MDIIAAIYVSGTAGIEIHKIEYGIDDMVVYTWYHGYSTGRTSRAKIRYKSNGNAYFISHGKRYNLADAIYYDL